MNQVTPFELALGLGLALILVDKIMYWIDRKRNGTVSKDHPPPKEEWKLMLAQMKDLHDWHNKEDEDGVKIWYVRRSLEEAIARLSENIAMQTRILERLVDKIDQ